MDRIVSTPRYKEIAADKPCEPSLAELWHEYGDVDDDELLLRAVVPLHDIQKMREAGPIKLDFPTLSSGQLNDVRELMQLTDSKYLQLASAELSIELSR